MEWIGFAALILVGLYLVVCAVSMFAACFGFSGKFDAISIVILLVGVLILIAAWSNKPFLILTK